MGDPDSDAATSDAGSEATDGAAARADERGRPGADEDPDAGQATAEAGSATATDDAGPPTPEELREAVEAKYDFENFGPADMAEMTAEEWDAVFDADSWITGEALLDRVERDLRARIEDRDVFAVLERDVVDGERCLLAYSDEGYAVVYPDGSIEGRGTVLRDVKPSVALASMDSYEVPDVPPDAGQLPDPDEVPERSGELGSRMMQVVGAIQLLAGLGLFVAWLAFGLSVVAPVAAFGFVLFGVFIFVVVANARLSDRFRAEEYRNRLRDAGVRSGERIACCGFRRAPAIDKARNSTVPFPLLVIFNVMPS